VEQLPAAGRPEGVVFLLAGGPGQAATRVFDLAANKERFRSLFPGYTLVTFDLRGTGESGVLRCESFETEGDFGRAMASCAESLGPSVSFYTTQDHAEDVEAVRDALGMGKVALWGSSYGAKLALAYAFAHPEGVERLLLDSPLALDAPDPYGRPTLRSLPRALRSLCAGGFCRGATRSLPAELAALANALQRKPLRRGRVFVNGETLLSLSLGADANGGLRAQLPAAVAEARRGRPDLLVRLNTPGGRVRPDPTFSFPLYVATTCGDGSFPWRPETPLADRERAYEAAVAALSTGSTGPFGRWAAGIGTARFCSLWPPSGAGRPLARRLLPDVPALVLSGGFDMRTPTESARGVARLFRRSSLLVVPALGHGVLASDPSGCASKAVVAWLRGSRPTRCSPVRPVLAGVGRLGPLTGGRRISATRVLEAVRASLRGAAAAWYTSGRGLAGTTIRGLHGGSLSGRGDYRFTLRGFSDVRGVRLSGRLDVVSAEHGPLLQLEGTVTLTGRREARGTITVSGGSLEGRLAGTRIRSGA
jgi:pimeloyl-ACP methyl ester carboxylesterase